MSKTLAILANVIANNTALTGTTQETVMLQNTANPFFVGWLANGEAPAILTVTRNGSIVQYLNCTDGALFIEAPVPMNDGSFCTTTCRNVRDWDYALRGLALNGQLTVGDIVEVKANGYYVSARLEVTEVAVAPSWSSYGVRQPVENVLVTVRADSKRYYGDNGYYVAQATGKTDCITGLVEAELSRW